MTEKIQALFYYERWFFVMGCKSAIYLVNSGSNTVTEGNVIPLGNVTRRFGKNLCLSGTGVVANGDGYYKVTGSFTVVPTATGVVGVTVRTNNVTLGSAAQTYADTANEPVNISVVCLVRNVCCDSRGFIEFVLSNGTGSVTQSSVVVEKI